MVTSAAQIQSLALELPYISEVAIKKKIIIIIIKLKRHTLARELDTPISMLLLFQKDAWQLLCLKLSR